MAEEQQTDPELQDILCSNTTSLVLQPLPVGEPPITLHCDVSLGRIRPFVPENFRREVFTNLHSLSHSGIRASCQQAKVSRHTRSKLSDFVPPSTRFEHAHIDLVGPLPPSEGFRYCLTCVDRFSKWPEVFPLVDISANTIATTFYSGWISRFGPPLRLTRPSCEWSSGTIPPTIESCHDGTWKGPMVFGTTDYPFGIQSHMEGGTGGNNCRDGVWSSHSTTGGIFKPNHRQPRSIYFCRKIEGSDATSTTS
ncbi:hypothetical protein AVEN_52566-1 [Araneus ventricosus]|uniref:Integrase catalytic domain-containing protein n=1 Tax=Araneus ventricosus TaxID=182803 RepID=A0A4Y2NVE2_ARAVE|nr:hypothetical protein AVEN_52566-1 [Araneus ventricosus]